MFAIMQEYYGLVCVMCFLFFASNSSPPLSLLSPYLCLSVGVHFLFMLVFTSSSSCRL